MGGLYVPSTACFPPATSSRSSAAVGPSGGTATWAGSRRMSTSSCLLIGWTSSYPRRQSAALIGCRSRRDAGPSSYTRKLESRWILCQRGAVPVLHPSLHPQRFPIRGKWARWRAGWSTSCSLIELKLAAGRSRDETDVVELVRSDPDIESEVAEHLARVHPEYAARFRDLAARARAEQDG